MWNSHPWNCSGYGSWGQGLVVNWANGWAQFWSPFPTFMNCIPKKPGAGESCGSGHWGSSWKRWMRSENEEKGALPWLIVIPRIFAASRVNDGVQTLGFQLWFQPKSGKFPTAVAQGYPWTNSAFAALQLRFPLIPEIWNTIGMRNFPSLYHRHH